MAHGCKSQKAAATATLMDADGKVGRAYGARTTPHMYVIDPGGTLVYAGAIDDKPTREPGRRQAGATNHVNAALAESLAGKPVGSAVDAALRLLGEVRVDVAAGATALRAATAGGGRPRPAPRRRRRSKAAPSSSARIAATASAWRAASAASRNSSRQRRASTSSTLARHLVAHGKAHHRFAEPALARLGVAPQPAVGTGQAAQQRGLAAVEMLARRLAPAAGPGAAPEQGQLHRHAARRRAAAGRASWQRSSTSSAIAR